MKNVVILCVIAGLLGGSIGYIVPVVIPTEYNKLFSVAILAGIESVCSVIKLIMRDKFKGNIFIITFFANVIIYSYAKKTFSCPPFRYRVVI